MSVCALSLAALLVQASAQAPAAQIRGRVVEEGSGKPVSAARVTLTETPFRRSPQESQRQAITDRDGRFAFPGLDAGGYTIQATKGGFAPAPSNAVVSRITVGAGEVVDDIRLALQRGGAIAGRVVDDAGEPLVEARVTAHRATVTGLSPMLVLAGQPTQTNDLGEFRLYGLPAGEYYVQITPRPDIGFINSVPQSTLLAPTYFPNSTDARKATPIAVTAGQTRQGIVVRIVAVRAFQISGIVVDESDKPVAGAMVSLTASSQQPMTGPPPRTRSDQGGRFTIVNVMPGSYMITAAIPVVIRSTPDVPASVSGRASSSISGGVVGGVVGGGPVTTETINGVTTQYRAGGSPTSVTVGSSDVTGIRLVARPVR